MDITNDEMPHLKKAFDGLEPDITRFLENSRPDWIIHDFLADWLPPAAGKLGISKAFYCIMNAWFSAFLVVSDVSQDTRTMPEDFIVPPKWVPFETKVAYKLHEVDWIMNSDRHRVALTIKGSDALIIRHCNEFQGAWLKLLEDLHNKPVIPVGLMPPHIENSRHDDNESWVSIKGWLDDQENGSVVYIALGSEISLNQADVIELAIGLELSMVPFFWALRKPSASGESEPFELPDGFEERVKARGVVWKSWAPQLNILSHESVCGFLTHCGWSSCIEGLMLGHPLIMLPFLVDQGLNARVLEDSRVGIEVPRNAQDGSFTRNSVAESVRRVIVEDDGKIFREKAKGLSAIFVDRELHDPYVDKFIEYLEKTRWKPEG